MCSETKGFVLSFVAALPGSDGGPKSRVDDEGSIKKASCLVHLLWRRMLMTLTSTSKKSPRAEFGPLALGLLADGLWGPP